MFGTNNLVKHLCLPFLGKVTRAQSKTSFLVAKLWDIPFFLEGDKTLTTSEFTDVAWYVKAVAKKEKVSAQEAGVSLKM